MPVIREQSDSDISTSWLIFKLYTRNATCQVTAISTKGKLLSYGLFSTCFFPFSFFHLCSARSKWYLEITVPLCWTSLRIILDFYGRSSRALPSLHNTMWEVRTFKFCPVVKKRISQKRPKGQLAAFSLLGQKHQSPNGQRDGGEPQAVNAHDTERKQQKEKWMIYKLWASHLSF